MGSSSNSIKLFGVVISTTSTENNDLRSRNKNSKGTRWSEDEHKAFLIGLENLGRGNWAAIAKKFVPSRTHTQVASHAQKYFARLEAEKDNYNKAVIKRHKSSVFDISSNLEESSSTSHICSSRSVVVPLKENNNKGKEPLNQESPISPMPISYKIPGFPPIPMAYNHLQGVSFNGSYAYVPMANYMFATPNFVSSSSNATPDQPDRPSEDNLDLTLQLF
ncbi:transcription factor MYB1R1-like [Lycium barbarum]|uniref:transcription factor MYB1R1-like n=1 Tax=Lycium barbarum TaxID=112863 RepID=UPI00293E1C6E|nr:transcription factor MYB1R1-like [Lycium barbarum]